MSNVIRTLAERISRDRIIVRKIPAELGGGEIHVSPDSALRLWGDFKQYDPSLMALAKEWVKRNSVVWDIGANVGVFTFVAANLAGPGGQVVAIEPDIWLAHLLQKTANRPSASRAAVHILPVAVSDEIGPVTLNIAAKGRSSNFIDGMGNSMHGGVRQRQATLAVSCDWLLNYFAAPSVVKIDVEGAEALLLKGAQRLLNEVRPVVICEVGEANAAAVTAQLVGSGYAIYDGEQPRASRVTLAVPGGGGRRIRETGVRSQESGGTPLRPNGRQESGVRMLNADGRRSQE